MAEQITGADLRLCLPRNEIPTADFIALAKELMLFKPTGFTANRAVRHFRRLGRRIYWDILRRNLEEDAVFESKAHGDYGGAAVRKAEYAGGNAAESQAAQSFGGA